MPGLSLPTTDPRLTAYLDRFSKAMAALECDVSLPIAVGVSGGGDSMALALLLRDWAQRQGQLLILTVDHGLRSNAAEEARQVAAYFDTQHMPHKILNWDGDKPRTHVQEEARKARYDLMLKICRDENIPTLAIAHNAEDQMETFWMRLAHGSGIDGLSGMAPKRAVSGVTVVRPLLSFTRAELREICALYGCPYIDDPSNKNMDYLRPRLRQMEDVLAQEGLSPQRLAAVMQKFEDASEALHYFENQAAETCLHVADVAGHALLQREKLSAYPVEMRRRLIARAITAVAPQVYPLPSAQLDDLAQQILSADFRGATLGGAEIFPHGKNDIAFCREAAAVKSLPVTGTVTLWDRKYHLVLDIVPPDLCLDLLGPKGVAQLRKNEVNLPENLSYKLLCALPTLWQGDKPVFIQALGYTEQGFSALNAKQKLLRAVIV